MWDQLARYLERMDDLRRFLDLSEAIERQTALKWARARSEARASAAVCSMAELEALVSGVLSDVNSAINATGMCVADLIPTLRPLAAHQHFISLTSLADPDKVWRQRQNVTCLDLSEDIVVLPIAAPGAREPLPPLDGRTLKPSHLQRIAAVYGVEIGDLIHTVETLSLIKLSQCRNDVAHGNLPFDSVFSRAGFQVADLRRDLDSFDEIGYRFVDTFDRYLAGSKYASA